MKYIVVTLTLLLTFSNGSYRGVGMRRVPRRAPARLAVARVIDGSNDFKNEYSFVVPIVQYPMWNRMCSGSVITPRFVLTAAHCVHKVIQSKNLRHLMVVYNNITHQEGMKIVKVQSGAVHPGYVKSSEDYEGSLFIIKNDIALLHVDDFDEGVPLAKLSALDYKALVGRSVTYIGAGGTYTHNDFKFNPKKVRLLFAEDQIRMLQIGKGLVLPCVDFDAMIYPMICLRPKCDHTKQGVQGGDSGGPVLYKGKVVGVCTGVEQRGDDRLESLYTPISPYLAWIVHTMKSLLEKHHRHRFV